MIIDDHYLFSLLIVLNDGLLFLFPRTHTPVATTTPKHIKAATATNECSDGVKDTVIAVLSVIVVLPVLVGLIFIILKCTIIKRR